ncbi:nucleotidyltransferase family protein [Sphingobacterium siyangense]|uniref:nucleotidyltransferase family protein n=1 Tax=Sphingobacterium siyangense TaxID=459529 RepID=UPI003DA662B8
MDNRIKDIFFQLLRLGLWGHGSLIYELLTEEDWIKIRTHSINHTVEGIIYDSFPFLTEDQLPPQDLRLKWAIRIDQIERHNVKMNAVIAEQFTAFDKYGLSPILQKGQGIACLYRVPLHRTCGDIDWYFEDSGYDKARGYLNKIEQSFYFTAGFSLEYESQNIHIEHHKKLFDIRSPLKRKFLSKIEKDYKKTQQEISINNVPIRLLAAELQLLQVNAHILKHLISFGIGLRQFCDSARLYYATCDQINPIALRKIYKNAGILKWVHLLHKYLVEVIGLPHDSLPFPYPMDIKINWFDNEVWNSGNFGFHDQRFENGKVISLISVYPEGSKRLWNNFRRYLKYAPQEVLFFPIVHTFSKF